MKILLTCSNKHPGVKTHLVRLKKILHNKANFFPIEELATTFPDFNAGNRIFQVLRKLSKGASILKIEKELLKYGNNIILGSWAPIYERLIFQLNKKGITPSFLWCSTVGQSEMSWMIELQPLKEIFRMLKKGRIKYLFVPEKTYRSICHIDRVKYLPHPITSGDEFEFEKWDIKGVNIDLFMKARPGKNVLQQMLSQHYSKTKFILHTNVDEKILIDLAKYFNVDFTLHSWLPEKFYFGLIKKMDLSLQVTWTESFNYAVNERMQLGVPPLVSPEILMVSEDRFLRKHLVIETPDSPIAIAERIDFLLENRNLRCEIIERGQERIREIAVRYNKEIMDQIESLFN